MQSSQPKKASPPLQFTTRGKNGVKTYWEPSASETNIADQTATLFEYSKDGSLLALVNPTAVTIFNTETGEVISTINRPNVKAIAFSPQNTYMVTWERPEIDPTTKKAEENLFVWEVKTSQKLLGLVQKLYSKETWPPLKWTDDETICARMVSSEIQFYAGKIGQVVRVLKIPNVATFCFAPGPEPYKLATFVPEKKNSPATVQIWKYPQVTELIAQKSFFKAQSAELLWNSKGVHLLVSTHTDVDRSGKSYYGEDGLYFISTTGRSENVVLSKEGPIHECAWSPTGEEFLVIYGFMPAKATLFGANCVPKAEFGTAPRNTIRWHPSGKLVAIAGFGNLQGYVDVWNPKKLAKVCTFRAHCTSYFEWSPNGLYMLSAILSPRLRVDNGYKIWTFDGKLVKEEGFAELYQISWRPALPGVYPCRLPKITSSLPQTDTSTTPTSASDADTNSTPAPSATTTAKYRHPNFSGTAAVLRREEAPHKYSEKISVQRAPPGADTRTKNQIKNQRKRLNKKKAKQAAGPTTSDSTSPAPDQQQQQENTSKAQGSNHNETGEAKPTQTSQNNSEKPRYETPNSPSTQGRGHGRGRGQSLRGRGRASSQNTRQSPISPEQAESEKKMRNVQKKLKQIAQLKQQQAAGKTLNPEQLNKIASEKSLLDQLNELSTRN